MQISLNDLIDSGQGLEPPCPYSNSLNNFDSSSLYEQNLLSRIATRSLEEERQKFQNKTRGLPEKYRKMLTNMKMVKSNQTCTVCLESFVKGEIIKKFPCKHIFHRNCAKNWLKVNKKCAICRMDLEQYFKGLEKEHESEVKTEYDVKKSTQQK